MYVIIIIYVWLKKKKQHNHLRIGFTINREITKALSFLLQENVLFKWLQIVIIYFAPFLLNFMTNKQTIGKVKNTINILIKLCPWAQVALTATLDGDCSTLLSKTDYFRFNIGLVGLNYWRTVSQLNRWSLHFLLYLCI